MTSRDDIPFVGRAAELGALQAALSDAATAETRFVLVTGDAGVGKSRLLAEFAAAAQKSGSDLASGAVPPIVGEEIPYAPMAALLRGLRDIGVEEFERFVSPNTELHRLLAPAGPSTGETPDSLGQLRLSEQFGGLLTTLALRSEAPLIVLLEDLHWADASTRALLAYLLWNLRSAPALVLMTYRSTGLAATHPWMQLTAEVARQPSVSEIELAPLGDEAILKVVSSVAPELNAGVGSDIARRSGGNPLFARELAIAGGGSLPRSVSSLMGERIGRVGPDARRFLHVLAVAGASLPATVVDSAAAAMRIDSVAQGEELRDAGLVRVVQVAGEDHYLMTHPLVAEVTHAGLMPGERVILHRLLGDVIETIAPFPPRMILDLAHHRWLAGDLARALPALMRAAELSEQMFAFAEAHILFERAILAASGSNREPRRPMGFQSGGTPEVTSLGELIAKAARAASMSGRPERAVELLQDPAAQPLTTRLKSRLADYLWEAGRTTDALEAHRQAIAALEPGSGEEAATLGAAARAFLLAGDNLVAGELAERAAIAAEARSDLGGQARALRTLAVSLAQRGSIDDASSVLERARVVDQSRASTTRVQPRPSGIIDLLSGYWSDAFVLERAGRADDAAEHALTGASQAASVGVRHGWGGLLGAAAIDELVRLGRWAEAESLAREMLAQPGARDAAMLAAYARLKAVQGHSLVAAGILAEAQDARGSTDPAGVVGVARAGSEISFWSAQSGDSWRLALEALSALGDRGDVQDRLELVALASRGLAEQAQLARDRRSNAELVELEGVAVELASRLIGLRDAEGPVLVALRCWAQAELARVHGNPPEESWRQLAERWERLREPMATAYSQWRAAEESLAVTRSRTEANALVSAAHEAASELGAEPLRRALETVARRARLDLLGGAGDATPDAGTSDADPADGSGSPARSSMFELSPRELEVLGLLTEGRSNRQIAQALFISERTAAHHVSSILGKMEAASRAEAAAMALRLGIAGPSHAPSQARSRDADPSGAGGSEVATGALLVSEIIGTHAIAEAIGTDNWAQLRTWHDNNLRRILVQHAGRELERSESGFVVAFSDIVSALDCGIAIQRSLRDQRLQHGSALRVRIGVQVPAPVAGQDPRQQRLGAHALTEARAVAAAAVGDELLSTADSLGTLNGRYPRGEPRLLRLTDGSSMTVIPIDWTTITGV